MFGPEIEGRITFNTDNYRASLLSPREIQGNELPSEWLLQSRRAWGKIRKYTWQGGVLGLVLTLVPIFVSLLLVVLKGSSQPPSARMTEFISWLGALEALFGRPFVSAVMGILGLVVAIKVITVNWAFISNNVFQSSKLEKQIWIGGGTTTIGIGKEGLSIKTIHSIFAVDWSAIRSYSVLKRSTYQTIWPVELQDAFRLELKHFGKGKDVCQDVLIIPKKFFDGESAVNWDEFETLLKANIHP